jgi:hypothetical protein
MSDDVEMTPDIVSGHATVRQSTDTGMLPRGSTATGFSFFLAVVVTTTINRMLTLHPFY